MRFGQARSDVFTGIRDAYSMNPRNLALANYATHKTEKVRNWLARRGHWHVHFTLTSASWLNQVERWFEELTRKKLRRGVHRSVTELNADIMSLIDAHNEKP